VPLVALLAWLAMAGRGLLLVMVLALVCAAPAHAGVVTAKELASAGYLEFSDPAGVPDDLHVSASGEPTVLVLGATVTAGEGCVAIAGGASCTLPAGAAAWDRPEIDTGGGDDTVVVDATQGIRVFGGAGNDRLTMNAIGSAYGMEGDDVLAATGSAALEGGPGNDTLSAGAASGISGGPGTDHIAGSAQDDVLVDAGDNGSADVIDCRGGADVTQGDASDTLTSCERNGLIDASKTKFRWRVQFGPKVTIPLRIRVNETTYYGVQAPFAECVGKACHRARFDGGMTQRIVSGGVRVKYLGRTRRGVGAGATIRAGLSFMFGDVAFSKGLEFHTRAHAVPTVRKRCTVTIPPVGGRERSVPCR
jgi:hypothetical protein